MKKKHNELKRKKGREESGHENKRASVLITKSSSKIPAMGQRLGRPAISLGQSETGSSTTRINGKKDKQGDAEWSKKRGGRIKRENEQEDGEEE